MDRTKIILTTIIFGVIIQLLTSCSDNPKTTIWQGALAKGEIYKPTKDGVVIYFSTENMDETLKLATSNGGQMLYPKTDNGIGLVAEFEDTEGNR